MRSRWIEVDEEVLEQIKARAEAFVDSPNDVLRRSFRLPARERPSCSAVPASEPRGTVASTGSRPQARWGDLLPQSEYDLPLLRGLAEHGGSAKRKQVLAAVEEILGDRLTARDRELLPSGFELRWQNRLGFARLRAVGSGHIKADSPRGLWELTERGEERLRELLAEAAGKAGERSQ